MDGTIGEIRLFAGNFEPRNWAFCNGQILAISSNTALFSILGTTYGGNGTTTFALPDLRSRVPVHTGQGPGLSNYSLGEQAGSETVTLNTTQIPAHTHNFTVNNNTTGMATTGSGNFLNSKTESGESVAASGSPSSPVTLNAGSVNATGGSQPHSNIQPYLVLNYIICLYGIFPSRN